MAPKTMTYQNLRQELRFIKTKTMKIITIKDMDTKVETSVPYATKKLWKQTVRLFTKLEKHRLFYEKEQQAWIKRVVNNES